MRMSVKKYEAVNVRRQSVKQTYEGMQDPCLPLERDGVCSEIKDDGGLWKVGEKGEGSGYYYIRTIWFEEISIRRGR